MTTQEQKAFYVDFSTLPTGMTHQEARELIKRAAELAGIPCNCQINKTDSVNYGFAFGDDCIWYNCSVDSGHNALPIYEFCAWLQTQKAKPAEPTAIDEVRCLQGYLTTHKFYFRRAILELADQLKETKDRLQALENKQKT